MLSFTHRHARNQVLQQAFALMGLRFGLLEPRLHFAASCGGKTHQLAHSALFALHNAGEFGDVQASASGHSLGK